MDFFSVLASGHGCSVEGAVSANPISAFVDGVVNSHIGLGTGSENVNVPVSSYEPSESSMNHSQRQSYEVQFSRSGVSDGHFGFSVPQQELMMQQELMRQQYLMQAYLHAQTMQNNISADVKEDEEFTVEYGAGEIETDMGLSMSHNDEDFQSQPFSFDGGESELLQSDTFIDPDMERYLIGESIDYSSSNINYQYETDPNAYQENVASFPRGKELYEKGLIQEAITALEAEIRVNESNDEAWRILGLCHAENDHDIKAIQCFRKAFEADPFNTEALLAMATSCFNENDQISALACIRNWILHNPLFHSLSSSADFLKPDAFSTGSVLDDVTQLVISVMEKMKGLEISHSDTIRDLNILLGVLYNVAMDYETAAACFRSALVINEDYGTLNKLGATLANSGKSDLAVTVYAKVLQRRPRFSRGWLNLGISYANLNMWEEASKSYVKAMLLTASWFHMWPYLSMALRNTNIPDVENLLNEPLTNDLLNIIAEKLSVA